MWGPSILLGFTPCLNGLNSRNLKHPEDSATREQNRVQRDSKGMRFNNTFLSLEIESNEARHITEDGRDGCAS